MKAHIALTLIGLLAAASGCATVDDTDGNTEVADAATSTDLEALAAQHADSHSRLPDNIPIADSTGVFTTVSANRYIDLDNEFFQDLGSNGRRCVSCHVPTVGWTITPRELHEVFNATAGGAYKDEFGLGAVFRTVDGANSPTADVSTLAKRRQAYSMLLSRGVIRIGLPVPATAEFELIAVDDPYNFASAKELSLFRRPLPTANLKFDSTVMWDGREVVPGETVAAEFATQASDAVTTHAQGQPLPDAKRQSIVAFETALASAQIFDRRIGLLTADGARGGPDAILAEPFHIGINDPLGDPATGAAFSPVVFTIYDAWDKARGYDSDLRRSVARGQEIFNSRPIAISGVSGINDEPAFGTPATLMGSCTTCHDTPNGGNHSVVAPLNIGLVDESRRTSDMPLYTLRNKTTGAIVKVTDPGRAMIDGKWMHIGRFKGPMLRNLAARAPYFHNGFAANFDEVIDFYEDRFQLGLSPRERADLIAFLRSL